LIIGHDNSTIVVDAIVNPAYPTLNKGRAGVCKQIFEAAGVLDMANACRSLAPCPPGESRLTPGFGLPARFVIHAVGPVSRDPPQRLIREDLLRQTYTSVLDQFGGEYNISRIGLCSISTGTFRYPLEAATVLAMQTVRDRLADPVASETIDRVYFCPSTPDQQACYRQLFDEYFPGSEVIESTDAVDPLDISDRRFGRTERAVVEHAGVRQAKKKALKQAGLAGGGGGRRSVADRIRLVELNLPSTEYTHVQWVLAAIVAVTSADHVSVTTVGIRTWLRTYCPSASLRTWPRHFQVAISRLVSMRVVAEFHGRWSIINVDFFAVMVHIGVPSPLAPCVGALPPAQEAVWQRLEMRAHQLHAIEVGMEVWAAHPHWTWGQVTQEAQDRWRYLPLEERQNLLRRVRKPSYFPRIHAPGTPADQFVQLSTLRP
jgi:O-acetyl-ADP-ribose deacetylase (regulator of RNase III)